MFLINCLAKIRLLSDKTIIIEWKRQTLSFYLFEILKETATNIYSFILLLIYIT